MGHTDQDTQSGTDLANPLDPVGRDDVDTRPNDALYQTTHGPNLGGNGPARLLR
jgi:hypothetical protein